MGGRDAPSWQEYQAAKYSPRPSHQRPMPEEYRSSKSQPIEVTESFMVVRAR